MIKFIAPSHLSRFCIAAQRARIVCARLTNMHMNVHPTHVERNASRVGRRVWRGAPTTRNLYNASRHFAQAWVQVFELRDVD